MWFLSLVTTISYEFLNFFSIFFFRSNPILAKHIYIVYIPPQISHVHIKFCCLGCSADDSSPLARTFFSPSLANSNSISSRYSISDTQSCRSNSTTSLFFFFFSLRIFFGEERPRDGQTTDGWGWIKRCKNWYFNSEDKMFLP